MEFLGRDNLHRLSHQMRSYLGGLTLKQLDVGTQRYRYLDSGPAHHKETILFLHGLSGNKTQWRSLMNIFSGKYRVIAFDVPGLCTSLKTASDQYDFKTLANEVDAFVNALALEDFHLFGHSLGASVGVVYAGRNGHKLSSLTLCSVVAIDNSVTEDGLGLTPFAEFKKLMMFNTVEDFSRLSDRLFYAPPKAPDAVLKYSMKEVLKQRQFYVQLLSDLNDSAQLVQRALPFIDCPCLVLKGSDDYFFSPRSEALLNRRVKNLTFRTLDCCGHIPHLEKPRDLSALYGLFLNSVNVD
ncbi:alpha/beta hydrolase [Litoribacillus peritrichatus]|uniref:Alpha/beta fold hydrolase n=1 Tax=Litoribacillus peritrichatus TaxID=718191 RepID=A0ABP7MU20_9GAMM